MSTVESRVNDLIKGAIDLHMHPGPSIMLRKADAWDAVKMADEVGMGAVMLKDHHMPSMNMAYIINEHAGCECKALSCLILNNQEGGLNLHAVDQACFMGVNMVSFPTAAAEEHLRVVKHFKPEVRPEAYVKSRARILPANPITVLDENGKLLPEVIAIIDRVAATEHTFLATGHLHYDEMFAVASYCKSIGFKRLLYTHLMCGLTPRDKKLLKELVELGGYVEFVLQNVMTIFEGVDPFDTPESMVEWIRFFGPERCTIGSDHGQLENPLPVEGYKNFLRLLINHGFTDDEIYMMSHTNPRKVMAWE